MHPGDLETNAPAVGGDGGLLDLGLGQIDHGTAIGRLEDVGVGLEGVRRGITRLLGVDRLGEGEFKAIGPGSHGLDLERDLAGPVDAFHGERLVPPRSPAAIGATHKQLSRGGHLDPQRARAKAFAEREAGSLVVAIDHLEVNPHDGAEGLVGDKQLTGEGTELARRRVAGHARGRLPHLAIGEQHGGRFILGNLAGFRQEATAALGFLRGLPNERFRQAVPLEPAGVPHEFAGGEVLEPAGPVPGALVVGVEDFAGEVGSNAPGRADPRGRGDQFAFRGDAHAPAAEFDITAERTGQAQHDPQVPLAVELRTERVLVVIARDFPFVVDHFEQVGETIVVGVADAGDVAALHHVQPAIFLGEAEHLVQSMREPMELLRGHFLGERVGDQPDFPATGGDGQATIGEQLEGRGLEHHPLGNLEGGDGVEVGLDRGFLFGSGG